MRKLRLLRAEKDMTLRELAERSGVSKDAISEIERGRRTPRISTLVNLAGGLGVDPQELLGEVVHAPESGTGMEPVVRTGRVGHFSAVYVRDGEWWLGYVEELTGANAQERSLEECRESLKEAVEDVLEANREMTRTEFGDKDVVREPLEV